MLVNVNVGSSLRERKVCECVACHGETACESRDCRKFLLFVLFWFRFASSTRNGVRDLTLCVKVVPCHLPPRGSTRVRASRKGRINMVALVSNAVDNGSTSGNLMQYVGALEESIADCFSRQEQKRFVRTVCPPVP